MKTKTVRRRAAGVATGNGGPKRGGVKPRAATPLSAVPAASTSADGNASPLANAVVGRTVKRANARAPRASARFWQLRLYVMDQTSKSLTAFANLKQFCERHLKGRYRITVIDLVKRPQLAKGDQILAIPTVVRQLPKPVRTIIGNLSDTGRALVGLDLRVAD